jgi:hypothetical protein
MAVPLQVTAACEEGTDDDIPDKEAVNNDGTLDGLTDAGDEEVDHTLEVSARELLAAADDNMLVEADSDALLAAEKDTLAAVDEAVLAAVDEAVLAAMDGRPAGGRYKTHNSQLTPLDTFYAFSTNMRRRCFSLMYEIFHTLSTYFQLFQNLFGFVWRMKTASCEV